MKEKEALHIRINTYGLDDDSLNIDGSIVNIQPCIILDRENSYNSNFEYLNDLFKRVTMDANFDITKYEKFYRYPNLDLSRDKMDAVKTKYNVRKVLDIDKADFRIISQTTVKKLTNYTWRNSLSSAQFLRSALVDYPKAFSDAVTQRFNDALEGLDDDHIILFDTDSRYNSSYKGKHLKSFLDRLDGFESSAITMVQGQKNMDVFRSLYDPNIIYVTDTYMNELSGEDSVTLDAESYKSIRAMLKTGNKEDLTVGMTMMANCNVAKSKTYLGLLFFHFSDTLRGGPVWNQVAFKTLKKQFDKYVLENNYYHSNRYSECIKLLAEDDALTIEATEHLINLVFKHVINGNSGINQENNVFKMSKTSIKLSEDVREKINNGSTMSKEYLMHHTDDLPF